VKTSSLVGAILIGILTAAIYFGGPNPPTPMVSTNNPFKAVDFSDLPALQRFTAKDGAQLAYRYYSPKGKKGGQIFNLTNYAFNNHEISR